MLLGALSTSTEVVFSSLYRVCISLIFLGKRTQNIPMITFFIPSYRALGAWESTQEAEETGYRKDLGVESGHTSFTLSSGATPRKIMQPGAVVFIMVLSA